jgi:hypothetical protein
MSGCALRGIRPCPATRPNRDPNGSVVNGTTLLAVVLLMVAAGGIATSVAVPRRPRPDRNPRPYPAGLSDRQSVAVPVPVPASGPAVLDERGIAA